MMQSPLCLNGNILRSRPLAMKQEKMRLPLPLCPCAEVSSLFKGAEILDTVMSHEKALCFRRA